MVREAGYFHRVARNAGHHQITDREESAVETEVVSRHLPMSASCPMGERYTRRRPEWTTPQQDEIDLTGGY